MRQSKTFKHIIIPHRIFLLLFTLCLCFCGDVLSKKISSNPVSLNPWWLFSCADFPYRSHLMMTDLIDFWFPRKFRMHLLPHNIKIQTCSPSSCSHSSDWLSLLCPLRGWIQEKRSLRSRRWWPRTRRRRLLLFECSVVVPVHLFPP